MEWQVTIFLVYEISPSKTQDHVKTRDTKPSLCERFMGQDNVKSPGRKAFSQILTLTLPFLLTTKRHLLPEAVGRGW